MRKVATSSVAMPVLWLIDDTPSLHLVAEATVALVEGWTFDGYLSGSEALIDLGTKPATARPQVILMDFFIGSERGDVITSRIRALAFLHHRPVIVGYSSVRSASAVIVAAGGDLILPKRANAAGINPDLLQYLRRWR